MIDKCCELVGVREGGSFLICDAKMALLVNYRLCIAADCCCYCFDFEFCSVISLANLNQYY